MNQKGTVQGPLHLLAQSMQGWPGAGKLGVVMARAGEGKTACLVQISLSHLMRGQSVLHISLEQNVEHVQSWYDALFPHVAREEGVADSADVAPLEVTHRRIIVSFPDHRLTPERLTETINGLRRSAGFRPGVLIIDGYPFAAQSTAEDLAVVGAFREQAAALGAELWMAVQTHREVTGEHPVAVPAPAQKWTDLIEVALFLEPRDGHIEVRLLKVHQDRAPIDTHLHLQPKTHRLVRDEEDHTPAPVDRSTIYTLLSGGAAGSEAEFGACAERWGLSELNFTFEGRNPTRQRNLVWLTPQELAEGAVSPLYLQAHMHRTFSDSDQLQKTLQSIWHQVNTSGEVFAVGEIQPDLTVKGGTGWAVELGRLWRKPIYVFDQAKRAWYAWRENRWVEQAAPVIRCRRFCGTGTRSLTEEGKAAISQLFERSFGPAS